MFSRLKIERKNLKQVVSCRSHRLISAALVVLCYSSGFTSSFAQQSASSEKRDASGSASGTESSTYWIYGVVSGSSATLTLSGPRSGSTVTNSTGEYHFSGLINGTYTVTPSKTGYTFSPSKATVHIEGHSVSGVDFKATPVSQPHYVTLTWTASTSSGIIGYDVYRGTVSGGPYSLISGGAVTGTSYTDNNVSAGETYYYVTTAVDSAHVASAYSNQAVAKVP